MSTYILRRLLLMLPTLVGVTVVVFTVMASSPGGITAQSLVEDQNLEPQTKKALEDYYNRLYGLDAPAPLQYLRWLNNVSPVGFTHDKNGEYDGFSMLKGSNLGQSFRYGRPVGDLIAERVPITLLLNVLAIPLIYLVAIGVGVQAATRRGSRFDVGSNMLMLGFWSVPTMLAGILLIGFFASEQYWHWFPTAGLSERTALDMPFLPHWSDAGDVARLFAGIVIATTAMIAVAKSTRRFPRAIAMGTLGFLAAWWMCNALTSYPGIPFQTGLSLVFTSTGVALALAESPTVRIVSFGLIGAFCGVVFSAHFLEGDLVRGFLFDRIWHLILPTFCLSYGGFAFLSRLMRSAVLENLLADYARTARAKGVGEHTVLWHHVFRNSLLPLITVSASLLPALLAGSVIVESIFSIDGMGKLAIEAVKGRDRELVLSITLVSGVLTLTGYLISDICYSIADPRVSYD